MKPVILLTFDVEDWFQVENLRKACPISSWSSYELRVEKNTLRLLDLLDSLQLTAHRSQADQKKGHDDSNLKNPARSAPTATFFILGWVAERFPQLVREIHSRGHEVASHGYSHRLCTENSPAELKDDLVASRNLLEDIIGERIYGYRAPNFSISDRVLKTIEDCGYLYDSSYNSFAANPRYGRISVNGGQRQGIALKLSDGFYELPISNLTLSLYPFRALASTLKRGNPTADRRESNGSSAAIPEPSTAYRTILPWGGGGYFRLFPISLFKLGVRAILSRENAYLFFCHPWEIDPDQPVVTKIPATYRFRHYLNLRKTENRLIEFMNHFGSSRFISCRHYFDEMDMITEPKSKNPLPPMAASYS